MHLFLKGIMYILCKDTESKCLWIISVCLELVPSLQNGCWSILSCHHGHHTLCSYPEQKEGAVGMTTVASLWMRLRCYSLWSGRCSRQACLTRVSFSHQQSCHSACNKICGNSSHHRPAGGKTHRSLICLKFEVNKMNTTKNTPLTLCKFNILIK